MFWPLGLKATSSPTHTLSGVAVKSKTGGGSTTTCCTIVSEAQPFVAQNSTWNVPALK